MLRKRIYMHVKAMMLRFFCIICFLLPQTVIPKFVDYSSIVSGVPETQPRTPEEVLWKQLDIIVMLAERGVPLDYTDSAGHSASFRACHELEVSFLEGAILLGEENQLLNHSKADIPIGTVQIVSQLASKMSFFRRSKKSVVLAFSLSQQE